jgi:hypothetical protein
MSGVFIPWYTIGWHRVGLLLGFERVRWLAALRISVWRDR